MKFACPKCTTRYSIADDKVPAATTLRFPCKKCGTVIRLRRKTAGGTQNKVAPSGPAIREPVAPVDVVSTRVANLSEINKLRAEAAHDFSSEHEATRVSSRAEIDKVLGERRGSTEPPAKEQEGEWYVLVAGKQKGPMTADEVLAMLDRKEIDKRTYVWRDGLGDWQHLGSVAEFKDQAGASGPAAWRVLQPTQEPAVPQESSAFDFGDSTVAMNQQQLKRVLAKTRGELAGGEPDQTPVNPATPQPRAELGESVERLTPDVSDPELLNALAGVPTGQRMTRPIPAPGSDPIQQSAELLNRNLTPAGAGPESPRAHGAHEQLLDESQFEGISDPALSKDALFPAATEEPVAPPSRRNEPFADAQDPYFSAPPTNGNANTGSFIADGKAGEINQSYVNAPPGESTRVFMATAGIYKRRRTHRITATVGILVSVILVGVVSLDIVGAIQIPGMGLVYDVTGLKDPNKDRAVKRVDERLSDAALDPSKRAELEAMKRKLLGAPAAVTRPHGGTSRGVGEKTPGSERVVGGEGIKETGTMSHDQRSLATSVFADSNKRETRVNLAETTEGPAPNLPSGLNQETIFKVITENSRSMNLCLTESMKKGEKLSGKMEIILTIAPDGSVPETKIEAPEFKSTQMASCTIRRIKSWRFPRFNGEPVTVSYPYLLQMGF